MSNAAKPRLSRRILYPIQTFIQAEAFSGILLVFIALLALIWANSAWADTYEATWGTTFTVAIGDFSLSKDLLHWINDGLMTIFFFVVTMEIKREFLLGEFASFRKASFPIMAAIGGMVVPALIFVLFNAGEAGISGWGIPMATDVAFALGLLSLLGKRVSLALKLFLVACAMVDDIGAVLVIALFYTADVNFLSLWVAFGIFGLLLVISSFNVRALPVYILLGLVMWVAFLLSGVHATVAGILLALTIPSRSGIKQDEFIFSTDHILGELHAAHFSPHLSGAAVAEEEREGDFQAAAYTIAANSEKALSPLSRLERALHPWAAFAIMPLFALANAGIFVDAALLDNFFNPLAVGIVLGLTLGKPLGIIVFAGLASAAGFAIKPDSISWWQVIGVGLLSGIGFTMSIFIANLAFEGTGLLPAAKLAILAASGMAAAGGLLLLLLARSVD
ncbi:Na+/H+ antiporter NhaA [Pontibacter beigongshangensis]|uniref:Na+/H+ antiporter NhaA n=1 Tax=Pontibacter beigongshangensis TaxID=2574733 RepID=UPI001650D0FE|nr:Na+/H+ antiporter NhaA [Pontibacter beigongshangensis]